jgi:hypothetical protein
MASLPQRRQAIEPAMEKARRPRIAHDRARGAVNASTAGKWIASCFAADERGGYIQLQTEAKTLRGERPVRMLRVPACGDAARHGASAISLG